jgi:thiamine biosynthesis lipoprotein ApbE
MAKVPTFKLLATFSPPMRAVAGAANAAVENEMIGADDIEIEDDGDEIRVMIRSKMGKMPMLSGFLQGYAISRGAKVLAF